MKIKVYIDTWMISQTVLFYLALMLTAQMLRATVSRLRLLVASLLGSILGLGCFLPLPVSVPMGVRFPVMFLLSGIVMLMLSFRVYGLRQNGKMFLTYFLALLILEGFSYLSYTYVPPVRNDAAFILLIVLFFLLLRSLIAMKRRKEDYIHPVSMELKEGEELSLLALVDTGNCLQCEGKGICIVEAGIIPGWFKEEREAVPISYQGIGDSDGLLICYKIPRIIFHGEFGEEIFHDIYIAESQKVLSNEGRFQMILPSGNLLENKTKKSGGIYGLLAQKTHSAKRKNQQGTK